jgi:MFS family permease
VFLAQYMQIARGYSPTASGLLTIPMVLGVMVSSTLFGQVISRTGRYKKIMLAGSLLMTVGLALMGTLDETTSLVELGVFMAAVGLGVGMVMQNVVLVVQNTVGFTRMGSGSALVAFFRSLAGAAGVSVLGAILGSKVTSTIADGLARLGVHGTPLASGSGSLPNVQTLPGPIRAIVEHGYGSGVGEIFLVAAPLGIVAFVAILLLEEVPLGTKSGVEAVAGGGRAAHAAEVAAAPAGEALAAAGRS